MRLPTDPLSALSSAPGGAYGGAMPQTFTGFPADAFAFYAELELDNSKAFWAEHKHRYTTAVAGPMADLLTDLEEEFGSGKMFRPYRDVRFSADKTPYKDHQGAYVESGPSCGYYVQISSGGLMVGAGWYAAESDKVGRYRAAIDAGTHVAALRAEIASLADAGLALGGDLVKTRPRGVPADHPDLDLMRHRSVLVSASFDHEQPWLRTPAAGDRVRDAWRQCRPFVDWLTANVTGES